jgi:hypothetical protein
MRADFMDNQATLLSSRYERCKLDTSTSCDELAVYTNQFDQWNSESLSKDLAITTGSVSEFQTML